VQFSRRTDWQRQPNRLSATLETLRSRGKPIFDLTTTNPTECGIGYPEGAILSSLSNPLSLAYQPNPRGLPAARESICSYYREKGIGVDPSNLFLTASTSEAYSLLFKLLCNAGDRILIPQPSYPLFDYLSRLDDVESRYYRLKYDSGWSIVLDSVSECITAATRAIVIVNPHNPTGMFLTDADYRAMKKIAAEHSLALIVDEVFIDFSLDPQKKTYSTAGEQDVLTFTLNGISKMAGLPQMKLGWIVVGGGRMPVAEASERLEILCDTFLSVNTPVQLALPGLLAAGATVRTNILARIRSNYGRLCEIAPKDCVCAVLECEGGWYGILRVPRLMSDEDWSVELLESTGVHLYPGYFFDFETEGFLVVSLLVEEKMFETAARQLVEFVASRAGKSAKPN
jgi:aspartate/methionine/tyrosine aminotransferase